MKKELSGCPRIQRGPIETLTSGKNHRQKCRDKPARGEAQHKTRTWRQATADQQRSKRQEASKPQRQRAIRHTRSSNTDRVCRTQHVSTSSQSRATHKHRTTPRHAAGTNRQPRRKHPTPASPQPPKPHQPTKRPPEPESRHETPVTTRRRVSFSLSPLFPFFPLGAGQCARRTGLFCCGQDCTRVCFSRSFTCVNFSVVLRRKCFWSENVWSFSFPEAHGLVAYQSSELGKTKSLIEYRKGQVEYEIQQSVTSQDSWVASADRVVLCTVRDDIVQTSGSKMRISPPLIQPNPIQAGPIQSNLIRSNLVSSGEINPVLSNPVSSSLS